jgi:flagellar basal-body rod protein FlgB
MMKVSNMFSASDRLQWESLNQRSVKSQVINSNIANAETPGFRAIGYGFEEQLQELAGETQSMRVSHPLHSRGQATSANGTIHPDVFVQPSETVTQDGNTVDLDKEMVSLAQNQILFRATVETLSRKIGLLKYAIHGGR